MGSMLSLTSFLRNILHSAIAQWWSIRLLTEGLQVRVLLAEPIEIVARNYLIWVNNSVNPFFFYMPITSNVYNLYNIILFENLKNTSQKKINHLFNPSLVQRVYQAIFLQSKVFYIYYYMNDVK